MPVPVHRAQGDSVVDRREWGCPSVHKCWFCPSAALMGGRGRGQGCINIRRRGGGGLEPKKLCTKKRPKISFRKFHSFPQSNLRWGGGGGNPPSSGGCPTHPRDGWSGRAPPAVTDP